MNETTTRTGSCICGAVRVTAENMGNKVGACHCGTCRKWGGGPYMQVNCGTDVAFEGEENIAVYDSSKWAERGFCQQCGSHLFYRLKQSGNHMVAIGLFDDQEGLVFSHQVFVDKRPSYYCFASETKDMTEADVFKIFGM